MPEILLLTPVAGSLEKFDTFSIPIIPDLTGVIFSSQSPNGRTTFKGIKQGGDIILSVETVNQEARVTAVRETRAHPGSENVIIQAPELGKGKRFIINNL